MNRSIFLLQVVGMYGGFQAEGIKTVLPSEAHVKFAMRLVPGQSPDTAWTLLEKHVKKVAKELTPGVTVTLTRMKKGEKAYVANRNSTSTTLLGEVLDEVYGKPHNVYRTGGGVPVTGLIYRVLGLESVSLGFGLNDEFVHAPDERYRTSNLLLAQRSYMRMILKLAKSLPDQTPNAEL